MKLKQCLILFVVSGISWLIQLNANAKWGIMIKFGVVLETFLFVNTIKNFIFCGAKSEVML